MTLEWTRVVPGQLALAAGVVAIVLGPLVLGIVRYHVSSAANTQYIGCELVTLAALLTVAAASFGRGDRAALLQAGACAYLLYTMVTVVFGQDYLRYPGTAERYFGLFVLVSIGALFAGTDAVGRLLARASGGAAGTVLGLGAGQGTLQRVTLVVVAVAFGGLWIAAILAERRSPSAEYLADPVLFWLVKYLDLAVVVPTALVSAAFWTPAHRVAGLVVLAFSFWMMLAIAGMQIAMVAREGSPPQTLVVAVVMLAGSLWCGFGVWAATITTQ